MKNLTYYLAVHGEAEPAGEFQDDRERPLTLEGKEQVKKMALKLHGIKFDFSIVSPTFRTLQTSWILAGGKAQILMEELYPLSDKVTTDTFIKEGMIPGSYDFNYAVATRADSQVKTVLDKIKKIMEREACAKNVLVVSHDCIVNLVGSHLIKFNSDLGKFNENQNFCLRTKINPGEILKIDTVNPENSKHLTL